MFVTTPEMKLWMPPGISLPGDEYWGAVMFASEGPWFLLTVWEQPEQGGRFQKSMAVAWESTLQGMLTGCDPERLVGLSCVRRADGQTARWRMHDVAEIWIAYAGTADSTGVLLFAHREQTGLFSAEGVAVDPAPSVRYQLANFSRSGRDEAGFAPLD